MAGTDKVQEEIIEEFSAFDEWLDRYEVLIGLGNELPAIAPAHRDEQHLIEGCQSRVWVDARLEEGKVYYSADSDAIITKGIIALLIRVLTDALRSRCLIRTSISSTASGCAGTCRLRGPTAWRR